MVDSTTVQRLKDDASFVAASPAGAPSWGDHGVISEIVSPLALAADALTEAQNQADFLGGPTALDRHVIMGRRRDTMLKCLTVTADRQGYQGGALVFVLGATENPNGTTTLTVLKKLP